MDGGTRRACQRRAALSWISRKREDSARPLCFPPWFWDPLAVSWMPCSEVQFTLLVNRPPSAASEIYSVETVKLTVLSRPLDLCASVPSLWNALPAKLPVILCNSVLAKFSLGRFLLTPLIHLVDILWMNKGVNQDVTCGPLELCIFRQSGTCHACVQHPFYTIG